MITYTIANWNELYENADTRKRKKLFWVLVPNGHDSLGYCSIMEMDNSLEVFAAWVLILQVASKCTSRGSLTTSKGRPYSAKEIATMTRAPAESIRKALEVLTQIGWVMADDPDKVADDPDKVADVGKSLSVKIDRKKESTEELSLPSHGPSVILGIGGGESGIKLPSPLAQDKTFMKTWESWCRYQHQSGNRRWGPEMIQQQLEHLAKMTPADASTSLCDAMLKGWQGPARVNHQRKDKGEETQKPRRVKADTETADAAIEAMKEAAK